jgi:hypothetical protein
MRISRTVSAATLSLVLQRWLAGIGYGIYWLRMRLREIVAA